MPYDVCRRIRGKRRKRQPDPSFSRRLRRPPPSLPSAVDARRLVAEALAGRPDRAEALLAADPGLAAGRLDVALVLGDADAVAAALAADPGLVHRELPGPGRRPLS